MNLLDIFEADEQKGYRTEKDDNTVLSTDDVRKTKLTLLQINRLRIMNDIRSLEQEKSVDKIRNQYKSASGDSDSL